MECLAGRRVRGAVAAWALAGWCVFWGAAGAAGAERPRVAFDRAGGFTVQQGEEASVTATLVGGSGGMWFSWEGNAGGTPTGDGGATFVLDTSAPGEYWLKAIGGSDGTDGDYAGKIRFRVAGKGAAAAMGTRAAGAGETTLLSEDFSGLTTGGSTTVSEYNGWTGSKLYNGTNCFKIGSGSATGNALSPVVTNAGAAGRVEYTLRAYGSDSTSVALTYTTDGGSSWTSLTNHSAMPSSATSYSVEFAASQTAQFKWTGTGKRFHLGPVGVYAAAAVVEENQPPTIDLEPSDTAVELTLGDTYEIDVIATEYDGDTITLDATVPSGATWVAENPGTGTVEGAFEWTPAATGTYTAVFAAWDKDGTNTQTVVFTVVPEGPGTLAFASGAVNARENSAAALTVVRTGGATGTVTVAWATANGTATAGSDYTAASGTLAFAAGETSKSLTVAVLDDSSAENNETFTVALSNATGGAALGSPSVCTVTIIDDDDANADYYASCYNNGVLKTGSTLKDALCKIINTGVKTNGYDSELNTILNVIDACPTNSSQVQCIYLQRGISRSSYNKEHLWAQSHGIDETEPGYSDLHHIRACLVAMNSARGNLDFDNCQGKSGATATNGCYYISNKAWEPPDSAKGDVARALLYMDVRYENKYNSKYNLELVDSIPTTTTSSQLGKLSTLLAWHELDPVDSFETNRNEKIYTTYQYNRNPFIDHPDWVTAVFDPDNYVPATVTWTVTGSVEGTGWVNGESGAFTVEVTNGLTKTFFVQPDASSYYHIGSITWNGDLVPKAYYTNASYYNYTCPAVSNHSTLAVVFAPELAALGTPVPWLVQYGSGETSVENLDWDAAELEDWNDDGVLNWEEYVNGTDPTALNLRQVTNVTVSAATASGFTVGWDAVDYVDGYRVRVCSTAVVDAASAGFESGLDAGWSTNTVGTAVTENAALDGAYGLSFGTNGAWLCSSAVTNPVAVEFKYKRSGNNDAWTLVVEVSVDGTRWTEAGSVANATTTIKTTTVDLSDWYGQTVFVRLRDARESGSAARYVDAVTVRTGGATVAEGTTTGTSWTATGLSAGTGYDVFVRGEATTLGTAVGSWSATVRATTATDDSGRTEQTITFPAIADQIATATVQLGATASSGLTVTYALDNGPAVLSGTTLTFTGAGTVSVTASQAGNEEYAPAVSVTRTFTVSKAPQSITFGAIADQVETATVQLSATAGSGLAVSFAVSSGPAVLDGTTLSFTGTGTVTVTASQGGNALWGAAADVARSFSVTEVTLDAPASAWASATNDTSFTAAWSAVAGAEGYELSVWTGGAAETVATTNETALFSNNFVSISGNGNDALNADFIEGWTCVKAYAATNEIKVGASGTPGSVTAAAVGATGTVRVVTSARAWSGDTNAVMWVGVTGCASQSNALTNTTAVFTNDFENIAGSVTVCWSNTSGSKRRFFLEEVSASEIRVAEETVAGTEPVPGYETRAVSGTSCMVTGLTAATTYEFHARATAGSATGAWSETAAVTTLSQGGGEGQAQSITFGSIADQVVGATVTLAATASSGLPVTYSVSGPASLEGTTLTCTGAGTVTVTASQAGNGEWAAAADVERSFAVTASPAELAAPSNVWAAATNETTFTAAWSPVADAEGYQLTVWTGGGGESVVTTSETVLLEEDFGNFSGNGQSKFTNGAIAGWTATNTYVQTNELRVGTTSAAGFLGAPVTATGAGTVRVVAAGRSWGRDSSVWMIVTAGGLVQSNAMTTNSAIYTNDFDGLQGAVTVSWSSVAASKRFLMESVQVSEVVVSETTGGTAELVPGYEARAVDGTMCVVTGLTASTEYGFKVRSVADGESSAWSADAAVTTLAAKQPQTITFGSIANQTVGDTVTLAATASSGLAVTYSVAGPATLSGNVLTCTGAGNVTVTASQAGNEQYAAAEDVSQSFTVAKRTQTITFGTIANQTVGDTVTLAATASSGLAVAYSVTGPATVSGNVLTCTGAGNVTVTASQAGNEQYAAAEDVSQSFTVAKRTQTITFSAIGNQVATSTVTLSATASSGLGVTFAVASGPASLSGSTLTFTGAGEVTVTASQTGNETYAAASESQTFTVSKASQTITFGAIAGQSVGDTVTLGATSSSGLSVSYTVGGPATLDGITLTCTGAGTVTVTASQDGNAIYAAAENVVQIFAVSLVEQSVTFPTIGNQVATNTMALSATASSGLDITFAVVSGPASLSGSTLTFTGAGEVTVTASQAGNGTYAAASESQTFTVSKASQTITFGAIAGQSVGDTVTLGATASSGLTVSYSVSGPATLDGTTLTCTGAGAVTVTASQEGNTIYAAASSVVQSFEVSRVSQVIEFTTIGNQIATNTVTLSATATSGLDVTFAVTSGPAEVNGPTLTFTGAGEVTVTATQAGNGTYASATASQTFTVSKASQGIAFEAIAGQSVGATVTLNASASSGLVVSYTVSGPATLEGNTLTCTGAGPVTVTANQSGNVIYEAATSVVQSFEVSLVAQSITFEAIGNQVTTNVVMLSATADSGLDVTFTVASGPAVVDGATLTFTGSGEVTVTATQAGNATYAPAMESQTFAVAKATQSIAFDAIAGKSVGDTVTLDATASSGLTVSYVVSGPATLSGNVVSCTGAGTVTVTASQGGNALYAAAAGVQRAFEVSLVAQSIAFEDIGNQVATNVVRLSATADSGLDVAFTVASGPAEVNGTTLTFTGAGEVTVTATQAGNGTYALATASQTFTVSKASQSITFNPIVGQSVNDTVTLNATASSGLAVSYVVSGPATLEGNTLTCTGAGAVTATASQRGNAIYDVATPVERSFEVSLVAQTIEFAAIGNQVATNTVALSAAASSGLDVTFAVSSGPAVLNGSTLTFTGAGEVTVTATQAGNGTYASATASQTFTVAKASQSITFDAIAGKSVGDVVSLSATASSGLSVSYAVSGPAALEGNALTCTGAGTVTLTASQTGNALYAAAENVVRTFEVSLVSQTIEFDAIGEQVATNAVTLSAMATSGLDVTFAVTSGPAEVNGTMLTFTGAGEVTVTATQAGNSTYASATESQTFTVVKAAQTITFDAIAGKSVGDTVVLAATASSGLDVGYTVSGSAILTGNTLTCNGAGTVTVTASQNGNALYEAATAVVQTFEVSLVAQSITFETIGDQIATNVVTLLATADSGLDVAFTVASGPAEVNGTTLTFTGAGEVTVAATQAGNSTYASATESQTFTVVKAAQTITFDAIAGKSVGNTVVLAATASSGLDVSYTVSGPATLTGNTLTCNGAGTVTVTASQNGSALYEAATAVVQTFEVSLVAQSITFEAIGNQVATNIVTLSATADSGLDVTFAVTSGLAELNGTTLTFTGAGEVTVSATQAGNGTYASASASQTFTVLKALQSIDFPAIEGQAVGDTVTLGATASSGLDVSYTVSGPATLTGNTLTCNGAGTVTVTASQDGNVLYETATPVVQSFEVSLVTQSIAFETIGNQVATNIVTLSATADSGLDVTFAVTSGPAELNGTTLTFTGAGEVSVMATQAGNGTYASATASQAFTVSKALQSIDFPAIEGQAVGDTVVLAATASSGLDVSYTVSGPATLAGNTLTCNGAGTVTVTASQNGNALYEAAPAVVQSFEVSLVTQSITFETIGDQVATNIVTLSATADSGLDVVFTVVSGPAEVNGMTLTFTGAGEVTVAATQAGNSTYASATESQTFTVVKAAQTITFDAIAGKSVGDTVVLEATASSGLDVSYTVSGPATLEGDTLTCTGAGTVTVTASQNGNALYEAATPVVQSFEVSLVTQSIAFETIGNQVATNIVTLSATADSGLDVAFTVVSGPAEVNGAVLTFAGAGEVTVTATQAGNSTYASATESQTFTVVKAAQTITFNAIAGKSVGDTVVLAATASSGLDVGYTVSGPAILTGNTLTCNGAGMVTVTASQNGNALYEAATAVVQTFEVSLVAQSITFEAIGDQVATNIVTLSATADSGLDVGFTVIRGLAEVNGTTLTFTGAGEVTVAATQAGNEMYASATAVQTFTVVKAQATVTLGALVQMFDGEAKIVTVETEPAGLTVAVTYDGASEAPSAAGNYAVLATVEAALWEGKASGTLVVKGTQTISFAEIADQTVGATVTLSATASSGLEVGYVVDGPAMLEGTVLTCTGAGTVTVTASQGGNEAWAAAESVTRTFDVVAAEQGAYEAWLEGRGLSAETEGLEYATAGVDDYDVDGISNWREYLADTDPDDAASLLSVSVRAAGTTGAVLRVEAASTNRYYSVVWSTNAPGVTGRETDLGQGMEGLEWTVPTDDPVGFGVIRVRLEP